VINHARRLPPGTRVDTCQIREVLGAGGFGITYRAIDMATDSAVAIKEYFPTGFAMRLPGTRRIQPRRQADAAMYMFGLQRFVDEAWLLAGMTDPNLVRVRRAVEDNGSAYIIMDYEAGLPLYQYLKRCGTLNETEIKIVFQPLLKTLHNLHENQCLHRDIKPHNILLRRNGSPVLLDFGSARHAMLQPQNDSYKPGTENYAPYEQYTSTEPQGPWTDIYSLGASLYQCITGQSPPSSPVRLTALRANRQDPLLSASLVGKGRYSPLLLASVDHMLQLDASNRPQSVHDLFAVFGESDNHNEIDWHYGAVRPYKEIESELR